MNYFTHISNEGKIWRKNKTTFGKKNAEWQAADGKVIFFSK